MKNTVKIILIQTKAAMLAAITLGTIQASFAQTRPPIQDDKTKQLAASMSDFVNETMKDDTNWQVKSSKIWMGLADNAQYISVLKIKNTDEYIITLFNKDDPKGKNAATQIVTGDKEIAALFSHLPINVKDLKFAKSMYDAFAASINVLMPYMQKGKIFLQSSYFSPSVIKVNQVGKDNFVIHRTYNLHSNILGAANAIEFIVGKNKFNPILKTKPIIGPSEPLEWSIPKTVLQPKTP